jgi:hypothetical protein
MTLMYVYVYVSLDEVDLCGCVCGFMRLTYVYVHVPLDEAFGYADIDDLYACVFLFIHNHLCDLDIPH